MVLLLSRRDVEQILTMDDAIDVVGQAHAAHARGDVRMPVRLTLRYADLPSELEAMPAYLGAVAQGHPALGMKVITYVATNAARGLPAISALVVLIDPDDGRPLAIMDGAYMTAVRTAAASAVATRLLAAGSATHLAILGSGVQARSHLWAMTAVRSVASVSIWGRTPSHVASFIAESSARYPDIHFEAAATVRDAVVGAEIVVTATSSPTPLLHWEWLRPGTHVNAIGSHSPETRELATDVVVNARRFVDSREANLHECGDFLIAIAEGALSEEDVNVEIGQVAAGLRPGRTRDDEVTLYKSGGLALQDVATAHMVYTRAREQGLGTTFEF